MNLYNAAMDKVIGDFIFFFTVIDPIGTVPVFIAATATMPERVRRLVAMRAALISTGVLLLCIVLGQIVLTYLGVDMAALRVAGGIILFLFALDMIFGESKPEHEVAEAEKHLDDHLDAAVYPLAIPSIAGPGAIMAVILRTENGSFTFTEQAMTAAVVVVVLALTLLAMLLASAIQRVIGRVGASIVSRLMGLLFAAIAADGVLSGIREFFELGAAAGG